MLTVIVTITGRSICSANSYCDNKGRSVCSVKMYCDNNGYCHNNG
jgi:hypothetical protein